MFPERHIDYTDISRTTNRLYRYFRNNISIISVFQDRHIDYIGISRSAYRLYRYNGKNRYRYLYRYNRLTIPSLNVQHLDAGCIQTAKALYRKRHANVLGVGATLRFNTGREGHGEMQHPASDLVVPFGLAFNSRREKTPHVVKPREPFENVSYFRLFNYPFM